MAVKRRVGLLLSGSLLGASILGAAPALAQDAETQKLQQQVNDLQQQLQKLQDQMAEPRNIPPGLYNASPPPMATKGPSWMPQNLKISLAGSFIAMEGAFRQHNEISSGASDPPFSTLPFNDSALGHENELRFSAQQSRIALGASGDINPSQHLLAYYEMDFLGAAVTANSRESNSYTPRIRQAFMEWDDDDYHFHLSAGQQWSLLTQDRVGMLPKNENVPLTIDAQYVVGFNWSRQPSLRLVEDWNKIAWFGLSIESPQTNFQSNSIGTVGAPAAQVGGSTIPPGIAINSLNVCNASGLLNSTTACSNDIAPDIIEKFALDPGWGHYEVFGLQRFFADEIATAAVPAWTQKVNFGWGVGGSVLLPVLPKLVDIQGSVMTGQGTGRYGSSQLADVFIGPDGTLKPLQTLQVLLGAVVHPWTGLDVYVYAGQEQVQANFWTIGATQGGYGNPAFVNNGCSLENLVSGPASFISPPAGLACAANVQRTQEITVGFWQNLYKGDLGRVTGGLQYEFVRLTAFPGTALGAGTPNVGLSPNNNIVFASLRYYPF